MNCVKLHLVGNISKGIHLSCTDPCEFKYYTIAGEDSDIRVDVPPNIIYVH